ncbi:hypothetical protein NUU61_008699 [Penicillium alfredii]|uniref:Uncharacterized protein n=1 Tax=Penicillium alfredii TaxID=1506179 RepID=A0A9W9JWJ4_9EURO|nr:uncharacterized protein NUU61_008699 [Penicillium alfredii]KAJ5084120.1 hypothetical protein NUU61_008699 [Penicillium alfredii]
MEIGDPIDSEYPSEEEDQSAAVQENIPEGWTANEPDLEEDDIDGNIQRCRDRIAAGIFPRAFKARLKGYKVRKRARDAILTAEPEIQDENVAQRLHWLKFTEAELVKDGDKGEHLPNVRALIKAYRSGKLAWDETKVTYWSKGKQLCEPQEFDVEGFKKINLANNGHKGFWVEGGEKPGPFNMFPSFINDPTTIPLNYHQHEIWFDVQVSDSRPVQGPPIVPKQMKFLDDSGSHLMCIFQDDLDEIISLAHGTQPMDIGPRPVVTANGVRNLDRKLLEARVLTPKLEVITRPSFVACSIRPTSDKSYSNTRLSGVWWKNLLYLGMAPDDTGRLYVSTDKTNMVNPMPDIDSNNASAPV